MHCIRSERGMEEHSANFSVNLLYLLATRSIIQ